MANILVSLSFEDGMNSALRTASTTLSINDLRGRADFIVSVFGIRGWSIFDSQLSQHDRKQIESLRAFDGLVGTIRQHAAMIGAAASVGTSAAMRGFGAAFERFNKDARRGQNDEHTR